MREALLVAVVLACPLMMMFMMRGGRGHGVHDAAGPRGGSHGGHDTEPDVREASTDELRRRRHQLDGLIEERERGDAREPAPTDRLR